MVRHCEAPDPKADMMYPDGLGRIVNSPLQLLQMLLRAFAQSKQYVHSNEQIIASERSNNSALHISHSVFISSKNHSSSTVSGN